MPKKKYHWCPAQDRFVREHYRPWIRGRAQWIADKLCLPRWQVGRRAIALGLSRVKERRWTLQDEEYLATRYHRLRVQRVAKYLGRTVVAVKLKAKRLGYRKAGEGYTARSLARALGVDERWVRDRIQAGMLKAQRRGTERTEAQGDYYYITDGAIVEMVKRFPSEVDLRKVDQLWFLDLMAAWLKNGTGNQVVH